MSATVFKKELYEPKKLDALHQSILDQQKEGVNKHYEILVDGFPVIGKTNDAERFMSYSDFIGSDSKLLEVHLFRSNNQRDRYLFTLDSITTPKTLEGITATTGKSEAEIRQEAIKEFQKDTELQNLQKENADLKKQNEEYSEEIMKLYAKLEELDGDPWNRILSIGEGAIKMVGSDKPVSEILSGLQNKSQTNGAETKTDTFKSKDVEDIEEEKEEEIKVGGRVLTDKEKGYISLIDDIRDRVGDVELGNMIHLMDLSSKAPGAIQFAIRQVTRYLKNNPENEK